MSDQLYKIDLPKRIGGSRNGGIITISNGCGCNHSNCGQKRILLTDVTARQELLVKCKLKIGGKTGMLQIKRAYDPASRGDGTRILVDRLWPRGLKKAEVNVAKWMKELGPSTELRKSFGHDPAHWKEFRKRYKTELRRSEAREMLKEVSKAAARGTVTLVYGAKDEEHNQAVVLKELLDMKLRKS